MAHKTTIPKHIRQQIYNERYQEAQTNLIENLMLGLIFSYDYKTQTFLTLPDHPNVHFQMLPVPLVKKHYTFQAKPLPLNQYPVKGAVGMDVKEFRSLFSGRSLIEYVDMRYNHEMDSILCSYPFTFYSLFAATHINPAFPINSYIIERLFMSPSKGRYAPNLYQQGFSASASQYRVASFAWENILTLSKADTFLIPMARMPLHIRGHQKFVQYALQEHIDPKRQMKEVMLPAITNEIARLFHSTPQQKANVIHQHPDWDTLRKGWKKNPTLTLLPFQANLDDETTKGLMTEWFVQLKLAIMDEDIDKVDELAHYWMYLFEHYLWRNYK